MSNYEKKGKIDLLQTKKTEQKNEEILKLKGPMVQNSFENDSKRQIKVEENKELSSEKDENKEKEKTNTNIQSSKDLNNEDNQKAENNNNNKQKVCQFIKDLAHELFIDGFGGMAQGLFCTLIAGTIVCQIGKWCKKSSYFGKMLFAFGSIAKQLMGAGIGAGIANKFKAHPLIIFSSLVCGTIGAFAKNTVDTLTKNDNHGYILLQEIQLEVLFVQL